MILNSKSKYSQIKKYFEEQLEQDALPKTLNSRGRYYRALPETVALNIAQIDKEIEEKTAKLNRPLKESDLSHPALAAKTHLVKIFEYLQNKSEWNKTLAEANDSLLNKGLH